MYAPHQNPPCPHKHAVVISYLLTKHRVLKRTKAGEIIFKRLNLVRSDLKSHLRVVVWSFRGQNHVVRVENCSNGNQVNMYDIDEIKPTKNVFHFEGEFNAILLTLRDLLVVLTEHLSMN